MNEAAAWRGRATGRQLDPGIEGLRAVAVLAVLVHHAFPSWLVGGFAGVDIFFVISGYVVGGRLLEAADEGCLSLSGFYLARARRLLPSLVVVLAATFAAGWMFLTGPELAALGKHMAASAAFSNNFLLASEAGYFDAPSGAKPLLHLWSLAIEEQFYLVAPLLILMGVRWSKVTSIWILRIGAASLLWFISHQDVDLSSAFYSPFHRFWELAGGVALATWKRGAAGPARPLTWEARAWAAMALLLVVMQLLVEISESGWARNPARTAAMVLIAVASLVVLAGNSRPALAAGVIARCLAWLGVALLVFTLGWVTSQDWPGPQSFIPVLGTVLVIACAEGSFISAILGSRPAVFVGGLSYPIYLWHWPTLVFARLVYPEWGAAALAAVLAGAVLLAWFTKSFVEDPVRFGQLGTRKIARLPWQLPAAALGGVAALGVAAVLTGGLPARFPPGLRALANWQEPAAYDKWRLGECYYYLNNPRDFAPACSPAPRAGLPTVLLWGDSHAAELYPGLQSVAALEPRFQLAQWTMGSCPVTSRATPASKPCELRRADDWAHLKTYRPDIVILGAAWGLALRAGRSSADISTELAETVAAIRRAGVRQVLVVGPAPLWKVSLSSDLFRAMVRSRTDILPKRFGALDADLANLDRQLQKASEDAGAGYFSTLRALCTDAGCRVAGDEARARPDLLFFDRDHLTPSGSHLVIDAAKPLLDSLIRAEGSSGRPGAF